MGVQTNFSDFEISQAVPAGLSDRDRAEKQSRVVGSEEGEVLGTGIFL
jgi:hypothetical protein